MVEISYLKEKVTKFRDERDWKKYHNPKDLSISISIEAAELLELFQWKDLETYDMDKEELREEMADIFIYLLSLADITDIDLGKAVIDKMEKNEKRYPAD